MFGFQLLYVRKGQPCQAAETENVADAGHPRNVEFFVEQLFQFMLFQKISICFLQMKLNLRERIGLQPAFGHGYTSNFLEIS